MSVAQQQMTAATSEEFVGMVKSYNARRGFGFIACEQTAVKFGRDVYISKAEAQVVRNPELSAAATAPRVPGEKQVPTLAEEDLVRFIVKFSSEGYPQAESIQCVKKFCGSLIEAPVGDQGVGRILCEELVGAFGVHEARVPSANCGLARFVVGDQVTFCVQGAQAPGSVEASLVMLVPRPQNNLGCILACCTLSLPRAPVPGGWHTRANLHLDCHALGDRIILSGLPQDADQTELMRFFSKHGATHAGVAHSAAGSFASVAFSGASEVARFVARSVHTFADDKETRLATLLPRNKACGAHEGCPRLPGLPAPQIAGGSENGMLAISWSPVVLATGYLVELRPAGVQAHWSPVDAAAGTLVGSAGDEPQRFGRDCASCKISGLPSNVVFEARVMYTTECGCRSDNSDASEWCPAYPNATPQPSPQQQQQQQQQQQMRLQMQMHMQMQAQQQALASMGAGAGMSFMHMAPTGFGMAAPAMQQQMWPAAHMAPQRFPVAGMGGFPCGARRCVHGGVLATPSAPEIKHADEYGFSLIVQWPSVAGATAYVVELRESGSAQVERFVRPVPTQAYGSLVELRVGGLRPRGGAGITHTAQVRSIGPCGCESEPSPPATSQPLASAAAMLPLTAMYAQMEHPPVPAPLAFCPMAPTAATAPAPVQEQLSQQQAKLAPWQQQLPSVNAPVEQQPHAKLAPWQMPPPAPSSGAAGQSPNRLPRLLQSSREPAAPVPSAALAPEATCHEKDIAPEIAGGEECIILD